MNIFDKILTVMETVASVGQVVPGVGAYATLADKLLKIILAGARAHEALTGQPLDLSKLHEIAPVE